MREDEFNQQIEAIGALRGPVRRALYRHVVTQPHEVSRDEAARSLGISRTLAAFHLDRLVEAGLLDTAYRRPSGRAGPGAGRPTKLYRRSNRQFRLSLPERRYELLARLMAEALKAGANAEISAVLPAAAGQLGKQLAEDAAKREGTKRDRRAPLVSVMRTLTEHGFEPIVEGEWISLRNCPFDAVARDYPAIVCGMTLSLLSAFSTGLSRGALKAEVEPAEGRCCVQLHRYSGAKDG